MNTSPLVSIVITSFNRLEDLKETVEKSKDIDYPNTELIIVDGGSTDGSVEYLNSLNKKKFKSIILGVDRGSAYSHNKGMETATGKYVITIDDDCFLKPSVVLKTVEIFEVNPNLAVIGYGLVNPKQVFDEDQYWSDSLVEVKPEMYNDSYQTMNYGSASAFRKSALEKVGYMDYDWDWSSRTEDVELNIKLIAHGYNTVMIPELVAYHKVAPTNRPPGVLTMNGINGVIWIVLKYYPPTLILTLLFKLFYLCIYFTILNKTDIYLMAILYSLRKSSKMIKNKTRLNSRLAKKIHLPTIWLFSIGSDVKWAGS